MSNTPSRSFATPGKYAWPPVVDRDAFELGALLHPAAALVLHVADGVDRDVGRLAEGEHVAEGERASRVAAVGVEDQHLLPVLALGAVEIHADGVVQRGPAVGLPAADALDETRVVVGAEAGDAHLGVEVDERDVGGVVEGVDELDRGGARVLDVARHAAAGVEQQADVQRRRVLGLARGEILQRLRLAVLEDLEVFRLEARDRLALLVDDGDAEVHEIDGGAEVGCCAWMVRAVARIAADGDWRRAAWSLPRACPPA